jgi:hypothetical protein
MALTKVSRGLLSTGIVDNSNATAITLNADESATFAGNVGIGASNSTYAMQVKKDIDAFAVKIENDGNSAGTSGNSYADASDGLWVDTRWNTATNTPFQVTTNSGNTPIIVAKGNGSVGIGTINPDNTLHVHKGSAGTVDGNTNAPLTLENSAANYIQMLAPNGQESGILFGNPANSADSGIIHSDADNTLSFRVGNNSPKVTFNSDGTIYLNNTSTYAITLATSGALLRGAAVKFLRYTDLRTPLQNSMTHNHMGFGFTSYSLNSQSPWADIIYLNSYGDASGGSPNAILVSKSGSNAKIVRYPHSTTSTTAISGGTQYGLDSASASDERLKENVNEITNGLAVINQLRPVTFNWNDTYIESGSSKNAEESEVESETDQSIKMPSSKVENVGLIAQEVEAVVPTVVHEGQISIGGVDYKNVDYKKLVPHLIAALQELSTKNDALEARMETLEAKVQTLENN